MGLVFVRESFVSQSNYRIEIEGSVGLVASGFLNPLHLPHDLLEPVQM